MNHGPLVNMGMLMVFHHLEDVQPGKTYLVMMVIQPLNPT